MNKLTVLLIVSALIVVGASSFVTSHTEGVDTEKSEAIAIPQDDAAAAKYPNGAKIYSTKCFVCHQVSGEGVPGAFPPLKNADYLLADKRRAVEQVLNGSNEAMEVNGAIYTIPMPFQVDTHQDAVDVINYVLNAWGNNGGTITVDEVKDIKIVR